MRYEEIVLDRVRTYRVYTIDADVVLERLGKNIKTSEMMLMMEEDAYQKRYLLDQFGKTEAWEVKTPATWWQHLKLALRTKWPRLFKRLKVRQIGVRFDSGWVCPELRAKVAAKHFVVPYVIGPAPFSEEE